jgi:hypothetical protein
MDKTGNPLLTLTELRYKNLPLLIEAAKGDDGVVGEIVRIHLVTEYLLEELIRLALDNNAGPVLSIGLRYSQKLELASQLELVEEFNLLPDYVVGSLRKLNKLRNMVAHRLNESIEDTKILDLFAGLENELPYVELMEHGRVIALRRYLAFIFGCMLPKFDPIENET